MGKQLDHFLYLCMQEDPRFGDVAKNETNPFIQSWVTLLLPILSEARATERKKMIQVASSAQPGLPPLQFKFSLPNTAGFPNGWMILPLLLLNSDREFKEYCLETERENIFGQLYCISICELIHGYNFNYSTSETMTRKITGKSQMFSCVLTAHI